MIKLQLLKIVAKILFLLLVMTFIFEGLRGATVIQKLPYVLKISNVNYSFKYIHKKLKKAIDKKKKYNRNLSQIQINELKKIILDDIITHTLISIEAKRLDVFVDDNLTKKNIIHNLIFFKNEKFNRSILRKNTKKYRNSSKEFLNEFKNTIPASTLIYLLTQKSIIPYLTKTVLEDNFKPKKIEFLKIPFSKLKIANKSKSLELKLVYRKNQSKFEISEKRKIKFLIFSSKSLINQDNEIVKKKIKNKYFKKNNSLTQSEEKIIYQIKFNSLIDAKNATKEILKGLSFKNTKKKYDINFNNYNLEKFELKNFKINIYKQLNKLNEGDVSGILKTSFGIYLLKIEKIISKKNKNFNESRYLLKKIIVKDIQFNDFLDSLTRIRYMLKQNQSIETIAKYYDKKLYSIEIINLFNKYNNLVIPKSFTTNALNTKINQQSNMFLLDVNRFCILRVTDIIPEKNKKLNEIKSQINQIWYSKKIKYFSSQINIAKKSKTKFFNFPVGFLSKKYIYSEYTHVISIKLYRLILQTKIYGCAESFIDYFNRKIIIVKLVKNYLPLHEKARQYKSLYDNKIQKTGQEKLFENIANKLKTKHAIVVNKKVFN